MLKRLYVDNYRCLVNFHLQLRELTVLFGGNGTGKSSVLAVVYALRKLLSGRGKVTDPDVFPAQSLTRWQTQVTQTVQIVVGLEPDVDVTYRLEIEHEKTGSRRARIVSESLKVENRSLFEFRDGEVQLFHDDHSLGPRYSADWTESAMARVVSRGDNQVLSRFLELLRGASLCAFNPKQFAAESTAEDPSLEPDGGNFASWYRHQVQERQDLVQGAIGALRTIVPDFQAIRLERVGSETRAFLVVFEGQSGKYELKLDELSDGQRMLIALYALIYLAGERDLYFLDEPTNYLALAEIQPWLMALSDACGSRPRQAVLCSHHPELLDYLGAECGVLLKRESSGSISAHPLSEILVDNGLKLSETFARGWET